MSLFSNALQDLSKYMYVESSFLIADNSGKRGCGSAAQVRGVNNTSGTSAERRFCRAVESLCPVRCQLLFLNSLSVHY